MTNKEKGFIKLYRSFLSWEWYQDSSTKDLFLHLLLTVNYEEKKWQGMIIPQGARLTSTRQLAKELGFARNTIALSLKKLQETGEIVCERGRAKMYSGTIIKISKWFDFQKGGNELSQDLSQDLSHTKEYKEYKEIKKNTSVGAIAKSDTLLPQKDNTPLISLALKSGTYDILQDTLNKLEELYPSVNILEELKKMQTWLNVNVHRRKTKSGIKRFIHGWLMNTHEKSKTNSKSTYRDVLPVYDASKNPKMSKEKEKELEERVKRLLEGNKNKADIQDFH